MLSTRDAALSDLPRLGELFEQYRQFYHCPPGRAAAQAFLQQRLQAGESRVIVAETAAAGVVGFCQLYPSWCSLELAPIYVLYDIYVLPSARRLGAGRLLLLSAVNAARDDGKQRIDLTTAHDNLSAQALYESMGWVRDQVFRAYSRTVR
ncbi:MAG: GNAT family N-acetyltransferase [Burkholderiales bacterium]|nr:GNAT family N-acetyltransferase [Burkholderiales bacterium]